MEYNSTPPFHPHPFLKSGMVQTIVSELLPQRGDIHPTQKHFVELGDGDQLLIMEYKPKNWKPHQRVAVLVHGLTGSYQSKYLVRITKKLMKKGVLVFRINLRGAGPGYRYAKNLYHSGRSEDTQAVIAYIRQIYPQAPITQIGFSMGANITLKMLGENSQEKLMNLDSAIAVSPPANLMKTSERLLSIGKFFSFYFVQKIRRFAQLRYKTFPELTPIYIPRHLNLKELDDLYLAPQCGFKNAEDYYTKCSSEPLLEKIQIPTLILHSHDDPIVDGGFIKTAKKNPKIEVIESSHGGHVAFIGNPLIRNQYRWMDSTIVNWVPSNDQRSLNCDTN